MKRIWILGVAAMLAGAGACGEDDGGRDTGVLPTGVTNGSNGTVGDDDDDTEGDDDDDDDGLKLDVGDMADGTAGDDGPGECESLTDVAEVGQRPQDIIVVIDNSGSMSAEAGFVQAQMNSFSVQIEAANVDSHIVLISAYPTDDDAGVCIEPPLGAGGCPGADSNPPEFFHVNSGVGSNNALQKIIDHYPDYSQYLRQTAVTHVVVVTDDDSDMSAANFIGAMAGLSPHLTEFVFHGIIAPEDPFQACVNMTTCCGLAAEQGSVYRNLIQTTGGVEGNLCEQQFQPIFQAVAQQVIGGATLACSYEIPPAPEGETFDKDEVNVEFDDGQGGTLEIGRVDDAAGCGAVTDGWYYDNPDDPAVIITCPQTCDKIQGFESASIAILFGCATIPAG